MMSDSRVSSVIQEWVSSYPGQTHNQGHSLDPAAPHQPSSANHMPPMDMMSYMRGGGGDERVSEGMMGLSYLPYASGVGGSNPQQNSGGVQQDFGAFLLPTPLRAPLSKRSISKDSAEYRLRREKNNIAVRKSRDKARRRVLLTQQRAQQLQDENHKLQVRVGQLTHELDTLKHVLSQQHLPHGSNDGPTAPVSGI
ncbi:unnamed protein product [Ophioblennius macclurei]